MEYSSDERWDDFRRRIRIEFEMLIEEINSVMVKLVMRRNDKS